MSQDILIYLFWIQMPLFAEADKRILSFPESNYEAKQTHEGAYFNVVRRASVIY